MTRSVRGALVLGLAVAALGGIAALNVGGLVRLAMAPGVPFDAEPPPPAPDYADPESWSALPERDDAADAAPAGAPVVDQRRAGGGDRGPREVRRHEPVTGTRKGLPTSVPAWMRTPARASAATTRRALSVAWRASAQWPTSSPSYHEKPRGSQLSAE